MDNLQGYKVISSQDLSQVTGGKNWLRLIGHAVLHPIWYDPIITPKK